MKKSVLKMMTMLCVMVVLVCMMPGTAQARGLADVQEEINQKKEELNAIEERIKANQNNKAAAEAALKEYEAQYDELVALIDEQEVMIDKTTAELDYKGEQLSLSIISMQENRELYGERLHAIYRMNSNSAMLSILLNVDSYSDMVQVSNALRRISERDEQLLQDLAAQQAEYIAQKEDLELTMANLVEKMQELQANRDWCDTKIQEMRTTISNANLAIKAGQEEKEYTQEEITKLQAEYNAIFAELQKKGSKSGDGSVRYDGPLQWPVAGHGRISSYYSDPRSNTGTHYGIDIPAATGTPITACAPGTVITSTWHYSYGYYIVLDHGDGLRTLYAHCSALHVDVGTYVEKGAHIANVGNTGNSFGAHLHLEVHDRGSRQDPLSSGYLSW